jgi:hypothetical protein
MTIVNIQRRLKRAIYQLPIMAPYRANRAEKLSRRFRDHPLGSALPAEMASSVGVGNPTNAA